MLLLSAAKPSVFMLCFFTFILVFYFIYILSLDERGCLYAIYLDGLATDYDGDGDVLATLSGTWYEVVYPVQMRGSEEVPGLDTRDHKGRHKVTASLLGYLFMV